MNATERKPIEEIIQSLEGAETVFILGCKGCPIGCDTGGQPWVDELTGALEGAGKSVSGEALVDMICNKAVVGIKLGRAVLQLKQADAILVGSCGVGVQATGNIVARRAVPAMDTVCMGDYQGLFPSAERCAECGECMIAYTGGLCPITLCAKSLVNGTCGGTQDDGSCEVSPERPCGWQLIFERLEKLGRLEDLMRYAAAKDYRNRDITDANRRTIRWALEVSQEEEKEAEPIEK